MRSGGPFLLACLLGGCAFTESGPRWQDQLEPGGPCYTFNLADGIDRSSTDELHQVFACLDRQGALAPLGRADAALDAPVRGGVAGLRLLDAGAALGNHAESLSLSSVVDNLLSLGANPDDVHAAARLGLELAYAAPTEQLGSLVTVNSQGALEAGVVLPLVDTAGVAATALLDDDLAPLPVLARALRDEAMPRLAWSLALLPHAPDPSLAALAAQWPALLADVVAEVDSPENDRNPGATGNSLRDLLTRALARDALVALGGAAGPILESASARNAVADWILDEAGAGRLTELDDGLLYLAAVNAEGRALESGDDSALVALLRLLRNGNREVDCELDGIIFDWHWSLGNLSVALLEQVANLDPDTASDGVGILGDALGYPLTTAILDTVADSGICPAIDAQLVADLEAVDRLTDPSTEPLLRALVGLLSATEAYIPEVVNTAAALHDQGLVEPTEELLRDLDHTDLPNLVLEALPAVAEPEGRQSSEFPAGAKPLDLDLAFDLALAATNPDNAEALSPLVNVVVVQDSTWTAAAHLRSLLLQGTDTETAGALGWLRAGLDADPELGWRHTLADVVDDAAVTGPLLEVVESPTVRGALTDTELSREGVIPWLARLYLGGTLDVLLDTLALVQDLLGDADA